MPCTCVKAGRKKNKQKPQQTGTTAFHSDPHRRLTPAPATTGTAGPSAPQPPPRPGCPGPELPGRATGGHGRTGNARRRVGRRRSRSAPGLAPVGAGGDRCGLPRPGGGMHRCGGARGARPSERVCRRRPCKNMGPLRVGPRPPACVAWVAAGLVPGGAGDGGG